MFCFPCTQSAGRLTRSVGQCHWAAAAPSRLSCTGSRWPAPRSATGAYSMTAGSAGQCLQNFAPRLGHAWRPSTAHTQGVSRTQLVCRAQVSPTLCAKFHVDCTVNNMKNPRCATGLLIRYVGLPFVIMISFKYDMYFAAIVIWFCICLDPWSIKNYYYYALILLCQEWRNKDVQSMTSNMLGWNHAAIIITCMLVFIYLLISAAIGQAFILICIRLVASSINAIFPGSHPGIYTFISVLLKHVMNNTVSVIYMSCVILGKINYCFLLSSSLLLPYHCPYL